METKRVCVEISKDEEKKMNIILIARDKDLNANSKKELIKEALKRFLNEEMQKLKENL
ncbi:hypothetical protein [Caminibacter mediatlanticus]|uniref:Uncharacterized protein n=1 Tax=Caminibacter mediatlanticus TB-2 TaxID=391592 RepID=A0AAI9AG07_9BACT|nr:hypothetical protein [Caminibacter mediatlanticus]EDM22948.1 hypothetical protein CMTB2_05567 [Caminibacter mediatlanticus TB-2]